MTELFLLPAKAYQLKENIIFLKTDIGNLVYDSKVKELNCIPDELSSYCEKNKLDVLEIQLVFLEEVIHDEAKINLEAPFKSKLSSYCKEHNQKNKELNREMYGTLAAAVVIALVGSFLI